MKVLFDANALASAYGTPGVCRRLLMTCLRKHIIYVSPYILDELRDALIEKFGVPQADVARILGTLNFSCKIIRNIEDIPAVSRDPKDDPVLAAALHANVDYLITGDQDLLTLKSYQGIPIIAPGILSRTVPAFED